MTKTAASTRPDPQTEGSGLWMALIAAMTVIGSYGLACVAPLAAVASLAALTLKRTEGLILIIAAWANNQAVGFLLLSYPQTADTFAWGAAIGAASVLAYFAAMVIVSRAGAGLFGIVAAFAAAFVAYQVMLYAYGVAAGDVGDAFSLAVVGEVLAINATAYIGFLVVYRVAIALALLKPTQVAATASA